MKNRPILRIVPLLPFLFLLGSCAMTPARTTVEKGRLGFELSGSGVLTGTHIAPVIPSLSIGMKYGLSDSLNIGLSVTPGFLFLNKTVLFEPYLVVNLLRQHGLVPTVNFYSVLPALVSFETFELRSYPLVGILPRYAGPVFGGYLAAEALYDRTIGRPDLPIKFNLRLGLDVRITESFSIGLEGGYNDIGTESELYGWRLGQPIVKLGFQLDP